MPAVAGLLVVLVGCAGEPAPVPSASETTPAPIVEPTPDPREGWPASRVPVECDEFDQLAVDTLRVPAATIQPVVWPLADGSAAQWQAGMLSCHWQSSLMGVGESPSPTLTIEVLADAAADFTPAAPSANPYPNLFGEGSSLYCSDSEWNRFCSGALLSAGYWVSFSLDTLPPDGATDVTAVELGTAAGTALSAQLAAAGPPRHAFSPPAGTGVPWSNCDQLDDSAGFRSALSSPTLTAPQADFNSAGTAMFSIAWHRVGFSACTWRQPDFGAAPVNQVQQVSVLILPGGAWAGPGIAAERISRGAVSVDVAGADAAYALCLTDTVCQLSAIADGNYLGVNLQLSEGAPGVAMAHAITALEFALAQF